MHYQSLDAADDESGGEAGVRTLDTDFAPLNTAPTEAEGAKRAVAADKKPRQLFSIGQAIKPAVIMAFSRQLSSFLEAGIPLLDALEIVGQQTELCADAHRYRRHS